jgi:hypothetical protein
MLTVEKHALSGSLKGCLEGSSEPPKKSNVLMKFGGVDIYTNAGKYMQHFSIAVWSQNLENIFLSCDQLDQIVMNRKREVS